MAQMGPAPPAPHLSAHHAVAGVGDQLHPSCRRWLGEAGPAAVGLELSRGVEELLPARRAPVSAVGRHVHVLTAPGRLGAPLAEDPEALLPQHLPPLLLAALVDLGTLALHGPQG